MAAALRSIGAEMLHRWFLAIVQIPCHMHALQVDTAGTPLHLTVPRVDGHACRNKSWKWVPLIMHTCCARLHEHQKRTCHLPAYGTVDAYASCTLHTYACTLVQYISIAFEQLPGAFCEVLVA